MWAHLEALIYSFPINFHYFHLSDNTPPHHPSILKSFQGYSILLVDVGNETNIDGMLNAFYVYHCQTFMLKFLFL